MKLGIIGNGFVGGSLYEGMKSHFKCHIYDIDPQRSHSTLEQVAGCDIIFLCVPTPMNPEGSIDLSYINMAVQSLIENGLQESSILVIKSTVTPGTCRGLQESLGLSVLSNPEFLTERFALQDFLNPRCIIIGGDEAPRNKLHEVYEERFGIGGYEHTSVKYYLTDSTTSELIKYMCNCFFAVKVTFANEMKEICEAADGNWKELVDGFISEGRVFPEHLDVPGHDGRPGFGGKCFPKDMNALIGYAHSKGIDTTLLSAAINKNNAIRK